MNALIVLALCIGSAVAIPAYGPAVISSGYGLGLGNGLAYGGYGNGLAIGGGLGYGKGLVGYASPIAATTYQSQSQVLAPVGVVKSVVATPLAPVVSSYGVGIVGKGLGGYGGQAVLGGGYGNGLVGVSSGYGLGGLSGYGVGLGGLKGGYGGVY